MATGERRDPYRSYNFLVEIDGITLVGFLERKRPGRNPDAHYLPRGQ